MNEFGVLELINDADQKDSTGEPSHSRTPHTAPASEAGSDMSSDKMSTMTGDNADLMAEEASLGIKMKPSVLLI